MVVFVINVRGLGVIGGTLDERIAHKTNTDKQKVMTLSLALKKISLHISQQEKGFSSYHFYLLHGTYTRDKFVLGVGNEIANLFETEYKDDHQNDGTGWGWKPIVKGHYMTINKVSDTKIEVNFK